MSTLVRTTLTSGLPGPRHEPTGKRVRAVLDGDTVVDSTRAVLLWEPRRVVPSWAVPAEDLAAELVATAPVAPADERVGHRMPEVSRRPVLDPSIPFAVHTAEGQPVDAVHGQQVRPAAGLRLTDPDLAGYVVLDFDAFDSWWEEDEPQPGAPPRPLPPHRHPAQLATGPDRAGRRAARRVDHAPACCSRRSSRPASTCHGRTSARRWCPVRPTRRAPDKGHASYLSPVVGGAEVPDLALDLPDAAAGGRGGVGAGRLLRRAG